MTGYTGHVQTEPNGLIYMRGRYYSPAWHCFLNPDGGADPKQWSQYAYAGGNPLVNVDPSGMSWLSNLWGDVRHGIHQFGHAMSVNYSNMSLLEGVLFDPIGLMGNPHYRKDAEIGAAVAACVFVDLCSDGALAGCDSGIFDVVAGGTNAIGGTVAANGMIGAAAGGAIGGSWKSAAQGAVFGACIGYGMNWGLSDSPITAAQNGLAGIFGPADNFGGFGMKALAGGIINTAMGQGSAWNIFGDGFIEGGILGGIGYDFPADNGALGYLGNQAVGEWAYRCISDKPTQLPGMKSPIENGIGSGLFDANVSWMW